jgi:hypothetical protein
MKPMKAGIMKSMKMPKVSSMKPGEMFNKMKMKSEHRKKNWIAGAIKKPGALHKELGVKKGEKIPAKKLATASKKSGVEGKRARLAETLKGFKHKEKHEMKEKKEKKSKK